MPHEGLPLFMAAGDPMICHCSAIGETAGHDCCVPVLTEQTHANNISSLVWLKALISFKEEDEEEEKEEERRRRMSAGSR